MTNNVGTTYWMAYDLFTNSKYSLKVDVYSYGIILWEIATEQILYNQMSSEEVTQKVNNSQHCHSANEGTYCVVLVVFRRSTVV